MNAVNRGLDTILTYRDFFIRNFRIPASQRLPWIQDQAAVSFEDVLGECTWRMGPPLSGWFWG